MDINSSVERMKQLMNHGSQDASLKPNVSETVEYKVNGPDGKTYGVVRERQKYFIKESKDGITFDYIGGLQNKSENEYPSYNSAYRNLELKIRSINESLDNGKTFEVLPANTTSEYIVEATQDMRNEIDRQRQIMIGVAKIMNEKNEFINKPKFKDPEGFGTATDPKSQGQPFTDKATAKLDKDPNFKATDPKKQGEPFTDKATSKEDKFDIEKTNNGPAKQGEPFNIDAKDILGNSVATKKPKGGKVFKVTESQLNQLKKYLSEGMFEDDENLMEYDINTDIDDDLDLEVSDDMMIGGEEDFEEVYSDNDTISGGLKSKKLNKKLNKKLKKGNLIDDEEDIDDETVNGENVFTIPSKVKYVGKNPNLIKLLKSDVALDYLGQGPNDKMSYVMVTRNTNGVTTEVEQLVPTKDLIKVGLNEGVWDTLKGVGSVGKYFGNKAAQGVKQGVQNTYNKAANAVNNIKQQGSQIYNQSQAASSQDKIDKIASNLAAELKNLNDRTIKSGGQPLNYNSVIQSLSNKLRGRMKNESIEENDSLVNEITEAVLNAFGQHPTYQKPAFTTPSSNEQSPYGQKIGSSAPFTKPVKQKVGEGEIGEDADETMKGKTPQGLPTLGQKGEKAPFNKGVQKNGDKIAKGNSVQQGETPQGKASLGKKGDKAPFNKPVKKSEVLNKLAESIVSDLKKKL